MCQSLGERANIRGSFTISSFTGIPFLWWFMRTRPLAARIMLTSFGSCDSTGLNARDNAKGDVARGGNKGFPPWVECLDTRLTPRAMRLRDPLARTHARRLHAIRLRGQSHPLPPVHYSHHATKTTPAKLRFLPFLPKSNPHHHFARASAYRFSFTSSFLPLFFLHHFYETKFHSFTSLSSLPPTKFYSL